MCPNSLMFFFSFCQTLLFELDLARRNERILSFFNGIIKLRCVEDGLKV